MVSVIMPAHKYSLEILDSIASVLSQTCFFTELIIIDDSGTGLVAKEVRKKIQDPRLKLFCNEVNLGSGPSRNVGIEESKGDYLAFCDADDIWHADKLEKQIGFMKEAKIAFCFSSYTAFDHISGKDLYTVKCRKSLGLWNFVKNTLICTSTVVLDKKSFQNQIYFPPIRTSQDTACWIGLLKLGVKAVPINEVLTRYREGNDKATKDKKRAALDYYNLIRVTLHLSPLRAAYVFVWYGFNAVKKRLIS